MVLLIDNSTGKAAGKEAHNRLRFARASHEERQAIVDEAHMLLTLDAMRQYGLLAGGPAIDWHACMGIVELGKEYGVMPSNEIEDREGT